MWDRLISIVDEIVSTLVRTSFSTIVNESYDLTCVVLDADANSIAQGTFSVPVFIGSAPITLRHMLKRYPAETLKPGDVIITNDPWLGTGHLYDITMVRPVFRKGRISPTPSASAIYPMSAARVSARRRRRCITRACAFRSASSTTRAG